MSKAKFNITTTPISAVSRKLPDGCCLEIAKEIDTEILKLLLEENGKSPDNYRNVLYNGIMKGTIDLYHYRKTQSLNHANIYYLKKNDITLFYEKMCGIPIAVQLNMNWFKTSESQAYDLLTSIQKEDQYFMNWLLYVREDASIEIFDL